MFRNVAQNKGIFVATFWGTDQGGVFYCAEREGGRQRRPIRTRSLRSLHENLRVFVSFPQYVRNFVSYHLSFESPRHSTSQ